MAELNAPEPRSDRDESAKLLLEHPLETEADWRAVAKLIDDLEYENETREDT